jgi:hypothetical protein
MTGNDSAPGNSGPGYLDPITILPTMYKVFSNQLLTVPMGLGITMGRWFVINLISY